MVRLGRSNTSYRKREWENNSLKDRWESHRCHHSIFLWNVWFQEGCCDLLHSVFSPWFSPCIIHNRDSLDIGVGMKDTKTWVLNCLGRVHNAVLRRTVIQYSRQHRSPKRWSMMTEMLLLIKNVSMIFLPSSANAWKENDVSVVVAGNLHNACKCVWRGKI